MTGIAFIPEGRSVALACGLLAGHELPDHFYVY